GGSHAPPFLLNQAETKPKMNHTNIMTTGLYNTEPTNSRFENLNDSVIIWAGEKGILDKATPLAQIDKTIEEVEETKAAIIANDKPEIIDGFGDILVTVLIGC